MQEGVKRSETKVERKVRLKDQKRIRLEEKAAKSSLESSFIGIRFLFFWLDPLVSLGNYTTITEEHVADIPKYEHCEALIDKFHPAWDYEVKRKPEDPSVFKVLWRLHWHTYLAISICEAFYYGLNFLTPYVIQWISIFFLDVSKGIPRDVGDGILYSFILAMIAWSMSFVVQCKFYNISLLGNRLRATLMAAIFHKSLTVDPDALKTTTTGETMNLMSNDAQRVNEAAIVGSIAWSSPTVIIIAMVLLYRELGVAAFAAIGLMVLLFPYQMLIAKLIRATRGRAMKLTDQRVKLVNEMLQGIRVIKLYAWEEAVADTLSSVRKNELRWTALGLIVRMVNQAILFIWPTVVTLVTMVIYTRLGNELTESKVLLMLSFLNVTRFPITMLPMCLSVLVELNVATGRISRYLSRADLPIRKYITNADDIPLDLDDNDQERASEVASSLVHSSNKRQNTRLNSSSGPDFEPIPTQENRLDDSSIELAALGNKPSSKGKVIETSIFSGLFSVYCRDVSFRWSSSTSSPPILASISIATKPGTLTAVIGPVGIGKSSLISAILGEMHTFDDELAQNENPDAVIVQGINIGPPSAKPDRHGNFHGRGVGYLAQDPWIIHGSLKDNVLLGLPLDEERLQWAIDVSALRSDLAILPDGIDTAIGDSGVNLSGGQKARVAMARLMYRADDLDVCLLDDPLSAVDMGVGKHIFENCILELKRRGKTIFLTLNSHLHILHEVDAIIVIDTISSVQNLSKSSPDQAPSGSQVVQVTSIEDDSPNPKHSSKAREPSTIIAHGSYEVLLASSFDFSKYEQQLEVEPTEANADAQGKSSSDAQTNEEEAKQTSETPNVAMSFIHGVNASAVPTSLASLTSKVQVSIPEGMDPSAAASFEHSRIVSPLPEAPVDYEQSGEFESDDEEQNLNALRQSYNDVDLVETERSQNFMDYPPLEASTEDGRTSLSNPSTSVFARKKSVSVQSKSRSRAQSASSRNSAHDSDVDDDKEPSKPLNENNMDSKEQKALARKNLGKEVNATGGISKKTYLSYFSGGDAGENDSGKVSAIIKISIILLTSLLCQAIKMLVDYWVLWWAADSPETLASSHTLKWWIDTSALWIAGLCLMLFLRSGAFVWTAVTSSQRLHDTNFQNVLSAPMSWFDTTPLGQIVNRFSKDIDIIDAMLPDNMLGLLQQILLLLGIVVAACISSYYFVIPMIPIVGVIYLLQKHFRNASTQLKRIEGSTFSPVYASFSSATRGAASIRAFAQQNEFIDRHHSNINRNSKIFLIYQLMQRWLAFRLDVLACFYIFFVGFVAVMVRHSVSASAAGLAVVYAMQTTGSLQFTVRQQIMLQGYFTAVERLNQYQSLPMEDQYSTSPAELNLLTSRKAELENAAGGVPQISNNQGNHMAESDDQNDIRVMEESLFLDRANATPKNKAQAKHAKPTTKVSSRISLGSVPIKEKLHGWPWEGEIAFEDITMAYRPDLPLVISGLTFTLPPGKKVGVVGRTGAGKSSLLLILFRMVELNAGRVLIDGIDTKNIGVGDLRSRMSIIPQQPVLFSGTVRYNLDPFGHHSDDEIYLALDRVNMLQAIESMEQGLLSHVAEFGTNFSQGQRQLLCIARALLRSNPIIVLDEATAAVDPATDAAIQKTIKECFSHCSIITIAHRLDTIVDYDYVLVLGPIDGEKAASYRRSKAIDPEYEYSGNPDDIFSMREFDSPYSLLTNPHSILYKMTHEGGDSLHNSLLLKAKAAHFAREGVNWSPENDNNHHSS